MSLPSFLQSHGWLEVSPWHFYKWGYLLWAWDDGFDLHVHDFRKVRGKGGRSFQLIDEIIDFLSTRRGAQMVVCGNKSYWQHYANKNPRVVYDAFSGVISLKCIHPMEAIDLPWSSRVGTCLLCGEKVEVV